MTATDARAGAIVALVTAAPVCAGLIIALFPLLRRYALARPNARSSHAVPTPQGAGIAVIAATLAIAGLLALYGGVGVPLTLYVAVILVALVGFVDDVRPIQVLPRLALQAIAVAAVLFVIPEDVRPVPALPLALERVVLLLAGLWFVNLVNFMDGLDLMTAAEAVPVTAALTLLGYAGVLPALPTLVAAALCGALLGFAPFNRPVAKVFLGDVGSLPIGLLLGWCLLQFAAAGHLTAALLLPLYYVADATLTLIRRVGNGEQFWLAHRSHFYQRATDNGFSVLEVVSRVFLLNCCLVLLALAAVHFDSAAIDATALVAGCCAVAFVLWQFSRPRR